MEVTGRVKFIGQQQQVTPTFSKRELVVTTEEQYPQHILIEFTQDKCMLLDGIQVGEPVKVSINLRGREWTNPQGETRYFNSIQGWRLEKNQPANYQEPQFNNSTTQFNAPNNFGGQQQYGNASSAINIEPAYNSFDSDDNDDLPF
jgi:single-strand DNA-binding protein